MGRADEHFECDRFLEVHRHLHCFAAGWVAAFRVEGPEALCVLDELRLVGRLFLVLCVAHRAAMQRAQELPLALNPSSVVEVVVAGVVDLEEE